MNLNLGSVQVPLNAATKTFALLAKRGAGKSYTGAVLAEEFFKQNIPFVIFDPIDVWWGLRLAKDGKQPGLPVIVFDSEHADIPLERTIRAHDGSTDCARLYRKMYPFHLRHAEKMPSVS